MRTSILLLLSSLAVAGQQKPANVQLSIWVREDIFAGFLDNDMDRHGVGVKKVEAYLAENPQAGDGIAWQGGSELLYAVRAHDAGDEKAFAAHYGKALEYFARAEKISQEVPKFQPSVLAITGGSFAVFADRLPARYQKDGWRTVREKYTALRAMQSGFWDKLPVHDRGELGAGLAQAAQRLGETELARKLTAELVASLPNTPYAVFGKRWLDKPETMAKSKLTCSSCHEPGRLQATLSRQ